MAERPPISVLLADAAAMVAVFAGRLAKTRKFMPSGLLVAARLVVLAVLILASS